MKNFRIARIKNGKDMYYRIQSRFLGFLWWTNHYIETGYGGVTLQFASLKEAKEWIRYQENPDKEEVIGFY